MRIEVPADVTRAVLTAMERTPDPRLRQIMASLARHLHAFVVEVGLTEDEFRAGVAWLCNKLADLDVGLAAGEVVLSGSFTRPVSVRHGDVVHADFGALGSLGVSFSD